MRGLTAVEILVALGLTALLTVAGFSMLGKITSFGQTRSAAAVAHADLRDLLREVERRFAGRDFDVGTPPTSFSGPASAAFGAAAGGASPCRDLTIQSRDATTVTPVSFQTQCEAYPARAGYAAAAAHPELVTGCRDGGRARVVVTGLNGGTRTYPRSSDVVSISLCFRLLPDAANPSDILVEGGALVRRGNDLVPVVDKLVLMARGDRSPRVVHLPPN